MKARYLAPGFLLLVSCTAVSYESPDFARQTSDHRTIAVLPFHMVFTGKAPKDVSLVEIERIEETESLAFQHSLYNRLLNRSSARRKRPILVSIQPAETSVQMLLERGIGIRDSWELPATELAELLGVDAVVRTRVEKTRYLSDIASYGISLGIAVLHEAVGGEGAPWVPIGVAKTYDVYADSSVLDGTDGRVLWKVAVERSTDWHLPANEVVEGITRKLARRFPYRG